MFDNPFLAFSFLPTHYVALDLLIYDVHVLEGQAQHLL